MTFASSPRATAEKWLAAEPDADMRAELAALLAGPDDELAEWFTGRLQFGTAGLRAAVGAGPLRMNRLVVRQAAAGLVDHLLAHVPDAAAKGVIIGFDARRKSDVFALDTARVCAARGVRALLFEQIVPTPVLAWNITERRRCRRGDGHRLAQPAGRQRLQGVPRHRFSDRASRGHRDQRPDRERRPDYRAPGARRPPTHRAPG